MRLNFCFGILAFVFSQGGAALSSEYLRSVTVYSTIDRHCAATHGDAPASALASFAGATFKTIYTRDGVGHAFTPGASYGVEFAPGKTIRFKVPLSHTVGDGTSITVVKGSRYVITTTIKNHWDIGPLDSVQTSSSNVTYDLQQRTCTGDLSDKMEVRQSDYAWGVSCVATILDCRIVDGIDTN
jgi:hypothetical protein